MFSELDNMPKDTVEEKKAYNSEIRRKMIQINATPTPVGGFTKDIIKQKKEDMEILIDKYIMDSDVNELGTLASILHAFQSKYKEDITGGVDMEHFLGPRVVDRPYGPYRRWGGKKRTKQKRKSKRRRTNKK
jgi:hypothetical protein